MKEKNPKHQHIDLQSQRIYGDEIKFKKCLHILEGGCKQCASTYIDHVIFRKVFKTL